ncbi:MAG TPA: hypothetical protein DCY13_07145, partial [Verrucomicrobiales bacterium]|nr:hypothetical protein [Verrucomicrobiales bacterium]
LGHNGNLTNADAAEYLVLLLGLIEEDITPLTGSTSIPNPDDVARTAGAVRALVDPDGDGDPSDGIDGWRLDVAAEVPMGFWRELRGWVKAINPQAFMTGEIWWDDYRNHTFKNARPWLDDAFDSVMNYRFGDAVYQFFNQTEPITATKFAGLLKQIHDDYGYERSLEQQNLFGSHDTSRIGSAVVNPQHRQDHGAGLQGNRDYDVTAPNASQKQRWRQMVAFQFLAPGAPYVYYGDEVGMWGADDPDCRKPMVWPDLNYQTERAHPFGKERAENPVSPDAELRAFYGRWIGLRNELPVLRRGDYQVLLADDDARLFVFRRSLNGDSVVAIFNAADQPASVPLSRLGVGGPEAWSPGLSGGAEAPPVLTIGARWFAVLRRN